MFENYNDIQYIIELTSFRSDKVLSDHEKPQRVLFICLVNTDYYLPTANLHCISKINAVDYVSVFA